MSFNKLLQKQVRKILPEALQELPEVQRLLAVINDSYNAYERDKELSERASRISEEEYIEINEKLKQEVDLRNRSVEKLREAIGFAKEEELTDPDDLLVIARYLNQQINKRKNAEKVFTSLIANTQSGILLEDETRHIVFTNQLFCNLFNIPVPPESLQGADCSNSAEQSKGLFKDPDAFVKGIDVILEEKKLVTDEILELADGRIFERSYIPIFVEQKYEGHLWSYTDITERKRSQDALIKSELANRLIMNAALDAIISINDKGSIIFWNPQAEKIFGWSEQEVIGRNLSEIIIPAQFRDAHERGMAHYMATGKGPVLNKIIEISAINKTNKEFPVELSIIPIKDGSGVFFCAFIRDISERKKAEQDLKESQEIWQFALEGAGDGVWEYDFETEEVFFSRQYKKMLGYEDREFENTTMQWLKRIHPDDWAIVETTDKEYFENRISSHQREYRIMHKDGHYRWILDRGMVISYGETGKPKRLIGTHTDITGRKKAEEEYKRISVVASANENGVVFTSLDGEISWSNEGFARITGYPMQEIIGRTPIELCKGDLSEGEPLKEMLSAFYKAQNFDVELVLYRKDGSTFWGKVTGQVIPDENGKPDRYFSIIENISYRKEIEQALKLREEKYRSIIANMNLGLLEVDLEENVQFVNQSFCDMCGYAMDELLGKKASTLFVRGENNEMMETKNDLRRKGVSDAYEISVKNKRGEIKWWLISGAPRFNEKGDLVGSIGIHLDITIQKQQEIELLEARTQAELSASAKQLFLANMSHEIRTPLNGILGMGRQLLKTRLNEKQKFFLDSINHAGEHLLVVINDILDISKIEAGKLTLETIGFELKEVIKHTVQVMQHRVEEKGLSLHTSVEETIAPVLLGDPYRLKQVMLNLVSNAIKFSEKGNIRVECTLGVKDRQKQAINITVSDEGVGMEKEFLSKLFQGFLQEDDTVSRKYGGTGLGMSITKQLVEMMGGSIRVESEKGKGTSVFLCIPFVTGSYKNLPAKEVSSADSSILKNSRILLVEDNEINRLVVVTTLGYYGADITETVNGEEAVNAVRDDDYDVILMDMQMPVMNGLEATRLIRGELRSDIPIIAFTANAIKGENEKCIEAGMNDYISKPFEEEDLVNMIAKWLGKDTAANKTKEDSNMKTLEKLYDLSKLHEISRGNHSFVQKMISLFTDQAPASVSEIKTALEENDLPRIRAIAHRIKPSLDNMGINSFHNGIRELEKLAQEGGPIAEIARLVDEMDHIISEVLRQLKED